MGVFFFYILIMTVLVFRTFANIKQIHILFKTPRGLCSGEIESNGPFLYDEIANIYTSEE